MEYQAELSMQDISRTMLEALDDVVDNIQRFKGLRSLWAESVANHVQFVATPQDLMEKQKTALHEVVYMALRLYDLMFPAARRAPHTHYFKCVPVKVAKNHHPPDKTWVLLECERRLERDPSEVDHEWRVGFWWEKSYWDAKNGCPYLPGKVRRWCYLPDLQTYID
jgi:hypothetical protein